MRHFLPVCSVFRRARASGRSLIHSPQPFSTLPVSPLIPVYSSAGSIRATITHELLALNERAFRIVRNRRGNIKRVILRELSAHAVPLLARRQGQSFEQSLDSGHRVWALGHVIGSGE